VTTKFLKSDRSMFELPGPRRMSRPEVPGAIKTPPTEAGIVNGPSGVLLEENVSAM